jgi:hypothetical protein
MNRVHLGLLATSVLISACGGGGESFGGQAPVSTSFPITSNNGVQTTRLSYQAALGSGEFAEVGNPPVGGAGLGDNMTIADVAPTPEDMMLDVISMIPFGPDVEPCLGGTGTTTLSGDVAVPGTFTVGDTFRIEYELCDEGQGEVIDGIINLTISDFSGDLFLGTYMLGVDADVESLEVLTSSDTLTANGDASITIDTMLVPFVATSVSGSQMAQTYNAGSETLVNYRSDQTVDGNQQPEEFTMDSAGTLEHSSLPGSVTYSTTTLFRGFIPSYPYQGVLFVQGENSTARLTVLDDNNVRVEIDDNGDGTVEYTEDMTWDAFLGNNT